MERSGRRPGRQDTRGLILAAAREAFGERGFEGTSIRQVAADAGVDPALVHHYFGTKQKLFRAVVALPIDPSELLPRILAVPGDAAENLVRTFLSVWDGPATGPAMRGVLRSAVTHAAAARLMTDFFETQIVLRIIRSLPGVDAAEVPFRASLVASQLFGLAIARNILKLDALAAAPDEAVVAAIVPTVHRYLFAPLA